ncbi:NADPH:quinone oxidoreductase family protein [soil metagenome]
MQQVVCTEWGPPEGLVVTETERPLAGPGEVVVQVAAAGVNFVDALFVAGTYQVKVPPPFIPGSELAGTVVGVGADVAGVALGQRVLASMGLGAWSTHVVLAPSGLVPVPDDLPLTTAAALVQSYCTAWYALTRRTSVAPGETVLVLGAGGGVGRAAVDVARYLGARVIAAASTEEKLADATTMGAEATIAYEEEDLKVRARELSDGGVDVVVDPVGGPHSVPALRALGTGGRLLVVGFAAGSIAELPANLVLLNNRTVVGIDWGSWAMTDPAGQAMIIDEVLERVGDGSLRPSAPTERPLNEAGSVLRDLLDRRLRGKVVLTPA